MSDTLIPESNPIGPLTESAKQRHWTTKYCQGLGLDIASKGDPVVPWAWSLDLPPQEFGVYNSGAGFHGPVQLHGFAEALPVADNSLDFVHCSHLLEDFEDWTPLLREWTRVLKPGGHLIVLMPDKTRWKAALDAGQPPNDAHRHEADGPQELTDAADLLGNLEIVECRFTDSYPGDYTIMLVGRKKA